jgi:hypothetical protein
MSLADGGNIHMLLLGPSCNFLSLISSYLFLVYLFLFTPLGYGLDDRGCRVRFPAGAGNFSLHRRV